MEIDPLDFYFLQKAKQKGRRPSKPLDAPRQVAQPEELTREQIIGRLEAMGRTVDKRCSTATLSMQLENLTGGTQ
jgi:hypothetical protein